jgi:hypothetical protein
MHLSLTISPPLGISNAYLYVSCVSVSGSLMGPEYQYVDPLSIQWLSGQSFLIKGLLRLVGEGHHPVVE